MKLTYIITTFNRAELLERAVEYVAAERCVESELIIVDDNSDVPVQMPTLAPETFAKTRLIRNHENLGVIGARNAGISAARGEYIIFLDDDDESLPERTKTLLSLIEGSEFDFVAARAYMGEGEKAVPAASGFQLTVEKILLSPPHIDAVIWRKDMLRKTRGLDGRVPYFGEHISMLLCLMQGGKAWLSDAVVARFAYMEAGLTQQTQQQNRMKDQLLEMFQILMEESETPELRQLFDKILAMLRRENIRDFDHYLQLLQPIMRLYR